MTISQVALEEDNKSQAVGRMRRQHRQNLGANSLRIGSGVLAKFLRQGPLSIKIPPRKANGTAPHLRRYLRERGRLQVTLISPKIDPTKDPVDSWYRYYAGYSFTFVEQAIKEFAPKAEAILDPWNGTGTTTVVAASKKLTAYGFDVNPAMVVVSRARLLGKGVCGSIPALADDILLNARAFPVSEDPLKFWFASNSSAILRGVQISVHRLLVDSSEGRYPAINSVSRMSTLAAFFYTALFRTIRLLISKAAVSNPTWWKPIEPKRRLRPQREQIQELFRRCVVELADGLHRSNFDALVDTTVRVADCRKIPLNENTVDAVISSPPYCTRIDYGISTFPELAVLGASKDEVDGLRSEMVGTNRMTGDLGLDVDIGLTGKAFLQRVKEHGSRASSTYYLKCFQQYYTGMEQSLREIRRVTKPGGAAVLVVQDNYYKEILNDTPEILLEMARICGFNKGTRKDFPVKHNRANMNPSSRKYRKGTSAVESVLVLR